MIFREDRCKNAGAAGCAEAFASVLSENQASEEGSYLMDDVLVKNGLAINMASCYGVPSSGIIYLCRYCAVVRLPALH